MESGVCGGASEFDIAGTGRVVVYTRWLEKARGLPPPSVGTQAESRQKSAVHEQRQEKAVKRSSTVVAVFKFDRCLNHWDRDVCPTRPALRETNREKPPTSTTMLKISTSWSSLFSFQCSDFVFTAYVTVYYYYHV